MIPKHFELHKPILEYLSDGEQHSLKDLKNKMAERFNLSPEECEEMLPSGRQTVLYNRVGWAKIYLEKAGLLKTVARGTYQITAEGQKLLADPSCPPILDRDYLMRYPSFAEFTGTSSEVTTISANAQDTPDDIFEKSFGDINRNLSDEIMCEIMKLSPTSFEKMVLDLLKKMGYGTFANASRTTSIIGDEGIDGIIMQDTLGFGLIYMQAKHWDTESTVGRPDIQSFVGAISGKSGSGLFVTTAKFSTPAREYAEQHHIVLIDGERLTQLMIEHNFGVSVKKIFEIKELDTDLFAEYSEE
ncbi:MAG: restriction endonuclease [Oscillospiraceae bacterium]